MIPGRLKGEFLRQLYSANIHPAALFPGLAGLGRQAIDAVELRMEHARIVRGGDAGE